MNDRVAPNWDPLESLGGVLFPDGPRPQGFGVAFALSELDSLQTLCLVVEAEALAGVEWPADLWDSIGTLGELLAWITHATSPDL